jgi:hypothetical protein
MYNNSPFWFKNKHYYEMEAPNKKRYERIKYMLLNNDPIENIKTVINDIDKFNSMFLYYTPLCETLYDILKINIDKIDNLSGLLNVNSFNVTKPFDTTITTTLNMQYVFYIQKYGVPDDGIFLEELLAEFA